MTTELVARFEKRYVGGSTIQVDLTQSMDGSSVTILFGPSGCGKTTILRCLAGLTHPDSGQIEFGGQTWFAKERGIARRPQQRDVGFLFQEYALFPHLCVTDNIGFGLKEGSANERGHRVNQMLSQFDLHGLERRFPHQLSGGQQQRVALARVLARRPQLLLLDEPLSALDSSLREQLRGELRRMLAEFRIPVIVVTHDRTEAISLAHRVALMDEGRIQQVGSVEEVFTRPATARLARLVGVETVATGEIVEVREGLACVKVGTCQLLAVAPTVDSPLVHVCIKGEDVTLQRGLGSLSSARNHLAATIQSITPEGPLVRVTLECGFELIALVTRPAANELKLQVGDTVTAVLKAPAIHLVPR